MFERSWTRLRGTAREKAQTSATRMSSPALQVTQRSSRCRPTLECLVRLSPWSESYFRFMLGRIRYPPCSVSQSPADVQARWRSSRCRPHPRVSPPWSVFHPCPMIGGLFRCPPWSLFQLSADLQATQKLSTCRSHPGVPPPWNAH